MRRVIALASAIVSDALRRKLVWVIILFAGLMAAAIPSLPSYGVGVIEAVFREVSLALMYVAAMVVMLALCANRIPSEIERRTVYMILARHVRRWEYVVGTWLGIVLVMAGVIAAFCAITQTVGYIVYGDAMWRLWQGAFALWLETGVFAAFAVAVSTIAGPVIVVVASIVFMFFTHVREGLLGGADSLLWSFYPSTDTFNIINPVAHGSGVSLGYLVTAFGVFLAWVAVLLVLGSVSFHSRDV